MRYLRQPGSHGLPTYALWASIFLVMGILTWSSLTIHAIATPSTIQRRVQPESFITSPLWTLGGSVNGLPLVPKLWLEIATSPFHLINCRQCLSLNLLSENGPETAE